MKIHKKSIRTCVFVCEGYALDISQLEVLQQLSDEVLNVVLVDQRKDKN